MTVYELTSRLMDEAFDLDWILKGLIRTAEDAANNPLSDFDKADLRCDLWQFFNSEYSDAEVEEWAKDVSVAKWMRYYQQDLRSIGEALIKLSQGEANSSEGPMYDFTPWRANAASA